MKNMKSTDYDPNLLIKDSLGYDSTKQDSHSILFRDHVKTWRTQWAQAKNLATPKAKT